MIYPSVEEKDEHSVGNHRHIKCHIVLEPAAVRVTNRKKTDEALVDEISEHDE